MGSSRGEEKVGLIGNLIWVCGQEEAPCKGFEGSKSPFLARHGAGAGRHVHSGEGRGRGTGSHGGGAGSWEEPRADFLSTERSALEGGREAFLRGKH